MQFVLTQERRPTSSSCLDNKEETALRIEQARVPRGLQYQANSTQRGDLMRNTRIVEKLPAMVEGFRIPSQDVVGHVLFFSAGKKKVGEMGYKGANLEPSIW